MLILGRAAQVYTSLQQQRAEMTAQIGMMLYGKARDSQEGALFSVLDEMAAQYYKELVFTYSVLLTHTGQLSVEDLDEECERFLEDTFDLRIDFALEDSLKRLEREGLILMDEDDGLPVAKDLDSAMVRRVKTLSQNNTVVKFCWCCFGANFSALMSPYTWMTEPQENMSCQLSCFIATFSCSQASNSVRTPF